METITVKTRFISATDDAGGEIDARVYEGKAGLVKVARRPYPYEFGGIEAHAYMARQALRERYGHAGAVLAVVKTTERGYEFAVSFPPE